MNTKTGFIERIKEQFVMLSFAALFVVLFFSMLLNYTTANVPDLAVFAAVVKCVFAAAVVLTIVFYQTARLKRYVRDKAFIMLLNLFAAIDLLFIFSGVSGSVGGAAVGNNVNVFDIVTTLYIVIGVSVLVWIVFWFVKKNAKESFYAFLSEIKISLLIMAAIIITEGVFTVSSVAKGGAENLPETALISTYMFFATAALCVQLTQIVLLNVKNTIAKIAAFVMLFGGLIYGITLLPFMIGLGLGLSVNALVVVAIIFAAATVLLFCISLYRCGKAENKKIHMKSAVLTSAGFAMSLLFINGLLEITGGLKTAFYIISVVLSVGFACFVVATYKYEKALTGDADDGGDGKDAAIQEPVIEDCDTLDGEIRIEDCEPVFEEPAAESPETQETRTDGTEE
ncbi:MAG: hypothetical protein LBP62_07300 [Clostridiales bacterium]|jgi:hypothetical protein|nr:hypothetical protein [Clostridiales bacterium]